MIIRRVTLLKGADNKMQGFFQFKQLSDIVATVI
jgi:hypothetical protein